MRVRVAHTSSPGRGFGYVWFDVPDGLEPSLGGVCLRLEGAFGGGGMHQ